MQKVFSFITLVALIASVYAQPVEDPNGQVTGFSVDWSSI